MSLAETAEQDSRRPHQALFVVYDIQYLKSCWQCAITLRSASAHRLRKLRTSSHAPLREMTHSQFQCSCSAFIASPFAPPLRQCHTTTPTPSGTCPAVRCTSRLTIPCPSSPVVVTSRSCATAHLASSRCCITKIMYKAPTSRDKLSTALHNWGYASIRFFGGPQKIWRLVEEEDGAIPGLSSFLQEEGAKTAPVRMKSAVRLCHGFCFK